MFYFVTNKNICPNIHKSIVDILLSKNPEQDDQEVGLVYTLLRFFLLPYPLSVLQNILGQEYF